MGNDIQPDAGGKAIAFDIWFCIEEVSIDGMLSVGQGEAKRKPNI
jgi:hypothetical protein